MTERYKSTDNLTFYSQKSIGLASFIGGPMAAGYLIKENYKALNQDEKGKQALIISIIATLAIFGVGFFIPETIMNKIPRMIIPAVYTGIIYFIVDKIHGTILNNHETNGNAFYSGWRATGIGFVSLIILLAIIFASAFLFPDKTYDAYDTEMNQFTKNEEESLAVYNHLNTENISSLIDELSEVAIPKWKENVEIINRTNQIEGLPAELLERNKLLLQYSELRIEAFELIKKSILFDSDEYDGDIDRVHGEIDDLIGKLNSQY